MIGHSEQDRRLVDVAGPGPTSEDAAGEATRPVLEVEDLHVEFATGGEVVRAVNGLSYRVRREEILAILGESGSGKSVAALAVMGLLDKATARITRGEVRFGGKDLLKASERELQRVRGRSLALVFQDATSTLNPVLTVGYQLSEIFRTHLGLSRGDARKRSGELLDRVRIPNATGRLDDYPHQFSGGMRQRVMIAMALALDPEVLIADEPTTALDVTVQADHGPAQGTTGADRHGRAVDQS